MKRLMILGAVLYALVGGLAFAYINNTPTKKDDGTDYRPTIIRPAPKGDRHICKTYPTLPKCQDNEDEKPVDPKDTENPDEPKPEEPKEPDEPK